ncbi:hypothetical protein TNCV_4849341 [Trichonephila clavipes]|nr:hypothetical protein TNCV_4849341 [Trichonephila clavipes]
MPYSQLEFKTPQVCSLAKQSAGLDYLSDLPMAFPYSSHEPEEKARKRKSSGIIGSFAMAHHKYFQNRLKTPAKISPILRKLILRKVSSETLQMEFYPDALQKESCDVYALIVV